MKSNVPKLRFKGFSDEWEEKKMSNICIINQGLQIAISDRFLEYKEGRYFYITNEFLRENSEKKYYIENPSQSVLCNKDDILMTRTGNTGKVVVNVSGAFHNNFFKINYDKESVNKDYLYQFLISNKIQKNILRLAGTSTIPDLNHKDFYDLKISMPSLKEQEKIAGFLTKVDSYIGKQEDKVKNLESYKKGMMQKIFSQEIRFKDEESIDYPEWEKKKLGDFLEFYTTNSLARDCLNYEGGLVRNIHYGDIHMKFPVILDTSKYNIPFINYEVDVSKIKDESYCQDGDVVVADASEDYNDIGKSIEINNIGDNKVVAGLHTILARDNKMVTAEGFKGYLMLSNDVRSQIKILAVGSKVLGISKTNLAKVEVKLPCLEEQTKIANFLSNIDSIVEKEKQKLENLKTWKKGLLQQMFV